MKKLVSIVSCAACLLSLLCGGLVFPSVSAANGGVDFLRESSLSCSGATASLENGVLVINATAAGQEVALAVSEASNLTAYPYWDGIVQSDVPFDIIFQDKTVNKWIYMSANFCYEFEGSSGASSPLPAGRFEKRIRVTDAYTWNSSALPSTASIASITFVAHGIGTIRVERCAMAGNAFSPAYPETVYQVNKTTVSAIPTEKTVADFCADARLQLDTFRTSVTAADGAALVSSDFVGTGDVITLKNGAKTTPYTAVVRGDLDASGTATTTDVRWLLRGCVTDSLSEAQKLASDIWTDQSVNTNDARVLLKSFLSASASAMQFTQESVVQTETFLSESKYQTFLSASSRDALLAGLTANIVPQGLAQSHKTGLLYMSGYSSSGGGSAITVFDASGRFCAEYLLYNRDGSVCTSHLGGVAVTDTTLFVSYDGDGAYRVAALPLSGLVTSGTQKAVLATVYEVPVATSFLSYYDGYLWMGNFYLPSAGYDLMRTINYTTDGYGCYIAGFDMSRLGDERLVPAGGQSYPTPDVLMAAPQKVQGMAFDTKTNTVILSHSYGRKNDSQLALYTVNLKKSADTTIAINDVPVPCFILSSPSKTVTAIPMAEGITLCGDGAVRVLFESGANKYSDGLHRTDHVWCYQY